MRPDELRLKDILEHIDGVLLAVGGKSPSQLNTNALIQNAVRYHLLVMGQAASHVSSELREKYSQVPWKEICGLGNTLAHQYYSVDLDLIWRTATNRLTPLRWQVEAMLQAEFPDGTAPS